MSCHSLRRQKGQDKSQKAKVGSSRPARLFFTMSSGPSQECRNGTSSGTSLLSIISMSSRTSGSQFSLMARLAEVCSSWMCIRPTENCESSGSCNQTFRFRVRAIVGSMSERKTQQVRTTLRVGCAVGARLGD